MNTPSITIEGINGSGKSSLAWAIKHTLENWGITCTIGGCEDEMDGVMEAEWRTRIESLAGKTISITTVSSKKTTPQ